MYVDALRKDGVCFDFRAQFFQVDLGQGLAQHHRVQVAFSTGIDLHRHRAGCRRAVAQAHDLDQQQLGGSLRDIIDIVEQIAPFNPPFIDVTSHAAEASYEERADGTIQRRVKKKRPGTLSICGIIQNRWGIDREGAFLKPRVSGDRVDLSQVDRMSLYVVRKEPGQIRWCMTDFIATATASMPELPDARRDRFSNDHGLSTYDAGVLTAISRAELDQQITTARAYPRSIDKFREDLRATKSVRQPDGSSRLCLSCHDGTVALGDIAGETRPIPMAGGEEEFGMHAFRYLIGNEVFQILQPDLFYFGGMIRCMKVARMAAAKVIRVDPRQITGRVRIG